MVDVFTLQECSVEVDGKVILAPQSFSVGSGDFLTLSGRSGAGKSTLLQLLLGFMMPTTGVLSFKGADVTGLKVLTMRESVAVVFQEPILIGRTVGDALLEPFSYKHNKHSAPSRNTLQKMLDMLDLNIGVDNSLGTLSGGEKQRIALARALLMERDILILDEVTSALDEVHRQLIFDRVKECGSTVIAVSHDSVWVEKSPRNVIITQPLEVEV